MSQAMVPAPCGQPGRFVGWKRQQHLQNFHVFQRQQHLENFHVFQQVLIFGFVRDDGI